MTSKTVTCSRCGNARDALGAAPTGGALGKEVIEKVCGECWDEWRLMEVRIINELKLNFMDPESEIKLTEHLRDFLKLD